MSGGVGTSELGDSWEDFFSPVRFHIRPSSKLHDAKVTQGHMAHWLTRGQGKAYKWTSILGPGCSPAPAISWQVTSGK